MNFPTLLYLVTDKLSGYEISIKARLVSNINNKKMERAILFIRLIEARNNNSLTMKIADNMSCSQHIFSDTNNENTSFQYLFYK